MEIDSQKLKKIFSGKNLEKFAFGFLFKNVKLVVLLISLVLLAFCIYIWYISIYASDWDEAKKQEYIKGKDQGVALNKSVFKEAVSEFESRKAETERTMDNLNDIFRLKN